MGLFQVLFRNKTTTVVNAETQQKATAKVEKKYNTQAFEVTPEEVNCNEENRKS